MIGKSKKYYTYFSLGLFLFVFLLSGGSSLARRATASPRISEEEAIAIATGGEIGPNDFRISYAGADMYSFSTSPEVAYNTIDNEYLVVWDGIDMGGTAVRHEAEIYGQRVDAATGREVGPNDFRISDMGPDGDSNFDAFDAVVAYDPGRNQYLVVWAGLDDTAPMAKGKVEIYGQFLSSDGSEVGENDFRITNMGFLDNDANFSAFDPAIVFNPNQDQFLIVWQGQEKLIKNGRPFDEYEIFGGLLNADGTTFTPFVYEQRISDMGPEGDLSYRPRDPYIIYNSTDDQYLVLWQSDDDTGDLVKDKQEIYGQLLDANAEEIGTDFRISVTGEDNNNLRISTDPVGAYNPDLNQYLVVWQADHNSNIDGDEREIYGQLLQADGNEIGASFRISDMGPEGHVQYDAENPAAAYNTSTGQYVVVWEGDDDGGDLVEGHEEIFGQFLDANGQESGENDFRVTYTGEDSDDSFDSIESAILYNPLANQFFVATQSDVQVASPFDEDEILGHVLASDSGDVTLGNVRLSNTGLDESFDAGEAAIAYNSVDDEYLVVWSADHNVEVVDEEYEIWGQRIDAATGAVVGPVNFRISILGRLKYPDHDAVLPAVAYNANHNQYLVVWAGLFENDWEIYGQILQADGAKIGQSDFRISFMGPDGNYDYGATAPDVAFNPATNQYIVVWSGTHLLSDSIEEHEIFAQLLNINGVAIGDQFRISDMGPEGDLLNFGADDPAVAHNASLNQYLVVWQGTDNASGTTKGEIYGQLLDATGSEIGQNDFRISNIGPDGNTLYSATHPDVAYNPDGDQYLVVWEGNERNSGVDDYEIYGQLLQSDGTDAGPNNFRISDMGTTDGLISLYPAQPPSVAFDTIAGQYLVVWAGSDARGDLIAGEFESFAQALLADGSETGEDDLRLSDMGPDGDETFDAERPAVACSHVAAQCLIVWSGDDDTIPLVDDEFEIFGQLYDSGMGTPPPPAPTPPPPAGHELFLPLTTQ